MMNLYKRSLSLLLLATLTGCASSQKRDAEAATASARRVGGAAAKLERKATTNRARANSRSVVSKEIRSEFETLLSNRAASRVPQTDSKTVAARPAAAPKPAPRTTNASLSRGPVPTAVVSDGAPEIPKARVPVLVNPEFATGEIATDPGAETTLVDAGPLKQLKTFETRAVQISSTPNTPLIFELPVTYNDRVKKWINFFQNEGKQSFRSWLERSNRYLPYIQAELDAHKMPQDLIYVAMIESGFSPGAVSPAHAVGMWQFIRPTAIRYGLRATWWLDERRDVQKSTKAAIAYMRDLYKIFGSWYLVAASYNMGEGGVKRLIKKHGSNDFWELADKGALPEETKNYVPKILAAMLIAKAPGLYGFRDLQYHLPHSYEFSDVPGGTKLMNLASYLGVSEKHLQELNPELIKGYVPPEIRGHRIRIPKGAASIVSRYVQMSDTGASAANFN